MTLRYCYLALLAAVLACQAGCCCDGPIARRTYWGCQCGQVFWNEWFSLPPACCDPCCGGDYVGSRNPYVIGGSRPSYGEEVYSDGAGYSRGVRSQEPTRAPEPRAAEPAEVEELPSMPTTNSSRFQQYDQAAGYRRPVDSYRTSRTLGRPPRERLLSR